MLGMVQNNDNIKIQLGELEGTFTWWLLPSWQMNGFSEDDCAMQVFVCGLHLLLWEFTESVSLWNRVSALNTSVMGILVLWKTWGKQLSESTEGHLHMCDANLFTDSHCSLLESLGESPTVVGETRLSYLRINQNVLTWKLKLCQKAKITFMTLAAWGLSGGAGNLYFAYRMRHQQIQLPTPSCSTLVLVFSISRWSNNFKFRFRDCKPNTVSSHFALQVHGLLVQIDCMNFKWTLVCRIFFCLY